MQLAAAGVRLLDRADALPTVEASLAPTLAATGLGNLMGRLSRRVARGSPLMERRRTKGIEPAAIGPAPTAEPRSRPRTATCHAAPPAWPMAAVCAPSSRSALAPPAVPAASTP